MVYNIFCYILALALFSQVESWIHTGKWIKNYKEMITIMFKMGVVLVITVLLAAVGSVHPIV